MKGKQTYTTRQLLSSMFMMLALAWLTVCLPYVNEDQQAYQTYIEQTGDDSSTDDSNPLNNTNEEKTESGNSLLSEYLHDVTVIEHNFITLSSFYKCHPSDLYHAYHPDLVIPPPEV
jgi:hypothetical protein